MRKPDQKLRWAGLNHPEQGLSKLEALTQLSCRYDKQSTLSAISVRCHMTATARYLLLKKVEKKGTLQYNWLILYVTEVLPDQRVFIMCGTNIIAQGSVAAGPFAFKTIYRYSNVIWGIGELPEPNKQDLTMLCQIC